MKELDNMEGFALGKENLKLLVIGLVIIIIGFILMVGGKASNPTVFNAEIFSFRRITLAPMVVLFGFLFEIYAIIKKMAPSFVQFYKMPIHAVHGVISRIDM